MTEPDRCPFCGVKVRMGISIYGILGHPNMYAIVHPGNDCILGDFESASYSDPEDLIADWNRRCRE